MQVLKWILFNCGTKLQVQSNWKIKIRGEEINQVDHIKFLGILLDEKRSCKKTSKLYIHQTGKMYRYFRQGEKISL